jgi:hypothetical protein
LANAGLNLELAAIEDAARSPIAWGIVVGLVVGKPLGIMAATGLGVLLRLGRLPAELSRRHLFGMSCVAGIGFTVSLFVADLSFRGARLSEAKTGILVASLLSGAAGIGWLAWASTDRRTRRSPSGAPARLTDQPPTADEVHAFVLGIVQHEARAIRWERVLLGALLVAATLETCAAVVTQNWQWALGVVPLLLGAVVVLRTTRRRQRLVHEMMFEAEP